MDDQPAATISRSGLIRLWPWWVLMLILLFVGFIRFRLLDMPLERDEGEYAYAGQLILQGIPPYDLAYNMKLPGTYYACALGMALFGQTVAGIHATLLIVNSLTIVFVFLLARRLFGVPAALAAAASYALMSISPFVLGMATHANQFVVLFAVPATWLLWKGSEENKRRLFFFSGLLYGLSFLMKQQGIFFGVFGGLYLIWHSAGRQNFAGTFKSALIYSSGFLLPFLGLCCLMAAEGVFSRFWFWTFTYAHSYVAISSWSDGYSWLFRHLKSAFQASAGLWFLGVLGLLLGLFDKALRGRVLFVAGLWLFAFFGTAAGLYFRSHYFILVLPAFSILIGVMVVALPKIFLLRAPVYVRQVVAPGLLAVVLGWSIFYQRSFFFSMPAAAVVETIYQGYPFIQSLAAANYIRERSSPEARIVVIGSEPEIYFYSQRHSATGYIYIYALNEPQPNAGLMQLDMIKEIEAARPEYLVWVGFDNSWLLWPSSDMTLSRWAAKYIPDFYKKVGVVDNTDGKIVYLWDADAANYRGPYGQNITVYQRVDPAQISSSKKN